MIHQDPTTRLKADIRRLEMEINANPLCPIHELEAKQRRLSQMQTRLAGMKQYAKNPRLLDPIVT